MRHSGRTFTIQGVHWSGTPFHTPTLALQSGQLRRPPEFQDASSQLVVLFVGCRKWVLGNYDDDACAQDFINAPMIYQKMIGNALQPKGGWKRYAERMKLAEEATKRQQSADDDSDFALMMPRTKFDADRQASLELDPVLRMVNDPYTDMSATNEPDESSLDPVFQCRSFLDNICFGDTTFDDCLDTLNKLLARMQNSVRLTKNIFGPFKVDFLSHDVSPEEIQADSKKMTAITKLPFPNRFIQDFAVYGAALSQLKEDDFSEGGDLAATKESIKVLQRKVAEASIPRYFDAKKGVHIMLYAMNRR
ncbi:LOW QUALITY PROTEIN: hypothetical protein PHMEG_00010412 [Phytophthora megakarya]|uniref:Uncharacterized protein n=1 Tax=Phytophthora megakarya TaxID=4795 RepID=A0A225WER7_9STRA|nr:LOW QUALITY PROTEIN: hypothetical protein PHMEG_00010412 [Phytophthora megakarya]